MEGSDRRQGREQRERNRSRSRHRSKSRSLSRSRSREGHKRKASHRGEKSRDRSRSYDRSSRRSSDRGRNHRSRRSFSRDNHSDRRNRRSSSRKRNKERDDSKIRDDLSPLGLRPVTLKDIISANPGISMPDAVNKLNTYNSAVARGEVPPPLTAQASVGSALIPIVGEGGNVTKAQREVYVGNLPPGIAVPQLAEFLNSAMKQIGLGKDNNSVVTAWISSDAHYAFVEFRTVEEANAALNTLNGIQVGNYSLKFGRTKSYSGTTTFEANLSSSQLSNLNSLASGLLHSVSSAAPAGVAAFSALSAEPLSDVVMVTNLSTVLDEQQIKDLFTPFGELKAFNVIKATGSNGQSAVFEYYQGSIADIVVAGMNNLDVVGQRISAQKVPLSSASVLLKPSKLNAGGDPVITENEIQAKEDEEANVSKVLCLNNMVDLVDLADDDLYSELIEDVADECNKYGKVLSVIIPRKKGLNSEGDSAVGKIFVELSDVETAKSVQKAVSGRKFNGNLVEAVFFSEDLFRKQLLFSPSGLSKVDHDLD